MKQAHRLKNQSSDKEEAKGRYVRMFLKISLGIIFCIIGLITVVYFSSDKTPNCIILREVERMLTAELVSDKIRYVVDFELDSSNTREFRKTFGTVIDSFGIDLKDVILGSYKIYGTVPIYIWLGFDLDELGEESVAVSADKSYKVTLPPVKILSVYIDITAEEAKIAGRAPLSRHLWDKLVGEPRIVSTTHKMLAALKAEDVLTEAIESAIKREGKLLGEYAVNVLSSSPLFSNLPYAVAFEFPHTAATDIVKKYIEQRKEVSNALE